MKMPRRIRPRANLQVDVYRVVSRAVDAGITYGWHRAHKHTDKPSPEEIKCQIETAVMNELSEVILWPNASDG